MRRPPGPGGLAGTRSGTVIRWLSIIRPSTTTAAYHAQLIRYALMCQG